MFLFWLPHTTGFPPVFQCLNLYMSEFTYVSISFTPMSHSFAIPPSQCAPAGSAERSINTLLVAWPVHNLLIAWPAPLHRSFYSVFHILLRFFPVFQCLSLSLDMFKFVYFFTCLFLCFHLFTIFQSQCAPHGSAKQSTNTVLVAWSVQSFLITSPASPYKAQQSYLLHSAIYPILSSTLSPSKTPGTSFSLTSSTTLWFRLTLR